MIERLDFIKTTIHVYLSLISSLVEETGKMNTTFNRPFLRFGQLSYVPIQASVCVGEMMTEAEKKWLRNYNQECVERMRPLVKDERVMKWLEKQAEEANAL